MKHILQDLSTPSLVSAIEGNLFAAFATMHRWPGAEVHDETELWWSMTDIPFSLFNSILRAKLDPQRIDAVIQSIIEKAKSRNVPLLWWTGPATQPADLGGHLQTHGFISDGQFPGMAVDLANLNQNRPMPTGFTIERVTDDANLMKWS